MSLADARRRAFVGDGRIAWGVCGWGSYRPTYVPSISAQITGGADWRRPARSLEAMEPRLGQSRSLSPPPPAPRVYGITGAAHSITACHTHHRVAQPGDFVARSATRLDSAGLSLSPSSGAIRARSPTDSPTRRQLFHTAGGAVPCIVQSVASAAPGGTRLVSRPATRQDSSVARGTASAMRRDAFASEHSPVFRRHWSVDRPMTTSSSTLRPPRPLSPVLPLQRQPFWQPYMSEFATTSYAE